MNTSETAAPSAALPATAAATGRRLRRAAGTTLAVLLTLFAALAAAAWLALRASLPVLDGELRLPGLNAPVTVARDALGVPLVRGASRTDVARATGFLHAQERLFQMDLMRRQAAGELAELLGAAALEWDRAIRVHRFRGVAARVVTGAGAADRDLLAAYTAGVNAGLTALAARPFEYLVLRTAPAPWREEDTVLVLLSMFIELHDHANRRESDRGVLYEALPADVAGLLDPVGTTWDAPIIGGPPLPPPLPGPEVLDLRRARAIPSAAAAFGAADDGAALGSNNWALAGLRTAHGGAIVANDMHLGLAVPNTWYRAAFVFPAARDGAELRLAGVTLPGTPALVVGSNGHVAWGFTNSYGDFQDLVILEQPDGDDESYLAPDGPRSIEHVTEVVRVRGGADVKVDVATTIWGPVVDRDSHGRRRALRWTAHEPAAVDLGLERVGDARTLEEALAAASGSGIPPQNFVCADRSGRIGWTIAGRIPRRVGFSGAVPMSWRAGTRRWDGLLPPGEAPRLVDPPAGALWTANARTVDGAALDRLGDGGYALGARALQIRDGLAALERGSEADMLHLQLDDRAQFLARWQRLLLDTLSPAAVAGHAQRIEARALAAAWGERAAVGSAGYRVVRAFRLQVIGVVLSDLTAACAAADERFSTRSLTQTEDAVWRLAIERPPHLLDSRHASWEALLLGALDAALDELGKGGGPLAERTWGARNTARIRHPLSGAVPGLASLLDMPADPLPGDAHMPRFQAPSAGASERMAVSPGREELGYLHMPCGQSGHPLSPFYRAGHAAWVRGEATPFLPSPAAHTLRLVP